MAIVHYVPVIVNDTEELYKEYKKSKSVNPDLTYDQWFYQLTQTLHKWLLPLTLEEELIKLAKMEHEGKTYYDQLGLEIT